MKKRNICILTMGIGLNQGGLLQAYALQTVLEKMGHKVWIENRKKNTSPKQQVIELFKNLFLNFGGNFINKFSKVYYSSPRILKKIGAGPLIFQKKYLHLLSPCYSNDKPQLLKKKFDTYIVGSDQVWRRKYANNYGIGALYNYYLDFTSELDVTRIAYAASFGISQNEWDYTPEETTLCKKLIQKFDAVSVREDDGMETCRDILEVDATHVLDPTMLLEKSDYIKIAETENQPPYKEKLFCYFLDNSEEKNKIAESVSSLTNLRVFSIMPTAFFYKVGPKHLDECIHPSPAGWLRAFMDAEFIVTDSFHGTVFSIIFNKPFIVIANKNRGVSRFTSLLKMFNLQNRMIYTYDELKSELVKESIDFDRVNCILDKESKKSKEFLNNALK